MSFGAKNYLWFQDILSGAKIYNGKLRIILFEDSLWDLEIRSEAVIPSRA